MKSFSFCYSKLREKSGFTLIEVLLALGALSVALPMGMGLINDTLVNMQQRQAAGHFTQVRDAVQQYMKDNYSTLLVSGSVPTAKRTLNLTTLRGTYLPASFSTTNVWRQGYQIGFYKTTRGSGSKTYDVLNAAITTTGGKTVNTDFANKIIPAAAMRAKAGFVVGSNNVSGKTVGSIVASDGSYSMAFTDAGIKDAGLTAPGQGHLADIVSMEDLSVSTDYLYRDVVPGHPELNSMKTNLSMADTSNSATGGMGNPLKNSNYPSNSSSLLSQVGGNSITNIGSAQLSPLHGSVIANSDGTIGGFKTKRIKKNADGTVAYDAAGRPVLEEVDICDEKNYSSSETADGKIFYYHTNSSKSPSNSANNIENDFGLMMCRNGRAYIISDSGNSLYGKKVYFKSDNERVSKPNCAHVGMTPTIYVLPVGITSSKTDPQPLLAYQTWAVDSSASEWTVRIRAKLEEQDKNTWLDYNNAEVRSDPNREMLRAMVMTMCTKKAEP